MDDIKKALQEIAKAIENNDTVESVKVVVTLKKAKALQGDHQRR